MPPKIPRLPIRICLYHELSLVLLVRFVNKNLLRAGTRGVLPVTKSDGSFWLSLWNEKTEFAMKAWHFAGNAVIFIEIGACGLAGSNGAEGGKAGSSDSENSDGTYCCGLNRNFFD
jgi:hypothetical protein